VWTLGSSSTISWPSTSVGGNGNGGVASIIKNTGGAIGYVDYADAKAAGLTYASVKNSAGNFIAPSVQSATTAASNATIMPNLTFSAIWAAGAQSYPITYQSWVLVYQAQSGDMGQLLQAWVGYLIGAGQQLLPDLNYAPLPSNLQQMAQAQLPKIGSTS
jgi:phosphate transport system substrate-binding protein